MGTKCMSSIALLAAASALLAYGPASADELVYGSWLPQGEYVNRVALPKVFAGIAKDTDGAVQWKLVPGGQLAGPKTTFQAVQDGLMAAGIGISSYVPNVIPAVNTIYSTVVFGDDEVAASGAALETMTLHCPQCLAEFRKMNAVGLSGWTAAPYHLTCREPVATLADLKGTRVRATAGYIELMRMAGAARDAERREAAPARASASENRPRGSPPNMCLPSIRCSSRGHRANLLASRPRIAYCT